jgi:hypothetical protein
MRRRSHPVSLKERKAHLTAQTDVLRRQTPRIRMWAHLLDYQPKAVLRGTHQGSADPLDGVSSPSGLAGRSPLTSSRRWTPAAVLMLKDAIK